MGTANIHLDAFHMAWQHLRQRFADSSQRTSGCVHVEKLWDRLIRRHVGVLLNGSEYCLGECLEHAVAEAILSARAGPRRPTQSHRVPLGLLLLSRQQITGEQLRSAIAAQQSAGSGKLGQWLLSLGYANQHQITAALARQWSCPVLRPGFFLSVVNHLPPIPLSLMRRCAMIPVGFAESSATLHIAFGDGIDYTALYAIEKMTGCRTAACMALPDFVQRNLQAMSERHVEHEAVFECGTEISDFARIVGSYSRRLEPAEIRVTSGGPYSWIRLFRTNRPPVDLLARLPEPA